MLQTTTELVSAQRNWPPDRQSATSGPMTDGGIAGEDYFVGEGARGRISAPDAPTPLGMPSPPRCTAQSGLPA